MSDHTNTTDAALAVLQGRAPFSWALALYQAANGFTQEDVAREIGMSAAAVGHAIHRPDRCRGARPKIAQLIGYQEIGQPQSQAQPSRADCCAADSEAVP